jgi:hypothetical protein
MSILAEMKVAGGSVVTTGFFFAGAVNFFAGALVALAGVLPLVLEVGAFLVVFFMSDVRFRLKG